MHWLFPLNFALACGGLLLLFITIGLFVDYYFYNRQYYNRWVKDYAWLAVLAVTVGGTALSLVYSEYFGFVPCSLCWLQRIALYPQALFAIMAFKTKESIFFPLYSIGLSIFGLAAAVYHYVYQMVPEEVLIEGVMPCLADGTGDCAAKIIDEFGFVTFPFLSAVMFAFLIIMYMNMRKSEVSKV